MNEHALRFGDNGNLIGIYTATSHPATRPGIVLVNSGVIHRTG